MHTYGSSGSIASIQSTGIPEFHENEWSGSEAAGFDTTNGVLNNTVGRQSAYRQSDRPISQPMLPISALLPPEVRAYTYTRNLSKSTVCATKCKVVCIGCRLSTSHSKNEYRYFSNTRCPFRNRPVPSPCTVLEFRTKTIPHVFCTWKRSGVFNAQMELQFKSTKLLNS